MLIFVIQVPQLIENYRLGNAEGVSLAFLTVWFIGDLANFFGAIWAGLVPTVIALAIYFLIADAVLITQCLYYNHVNAHTQSTGDLARAESTAEDQPLLGRRPSDIGLPGSRRRSSISIKRRGSATGAPILPTIPEDGTYSRPWVKNTLAVLAVCAVGVAGWAIAWSLHLWKPAPDDLDTENADRHPGAEFLGYLSAVLYLG